MNEKISVEGARVHNLKNVSLDIPRNKLVVFTGLSGSGKSSLAFDTIHAEGQRRYIETFASYARQFLGNIDRPDVDKISGLSPVISIEQKTVSRSPRSTVGTITEIYDFLRLLYARVGTAYSYNTGEKMVRYSEQEIRDIILKKHQDKKFLLLAPLIKGRKGHYRELFVQLRKKGYTRIRVDGEILELEPGLKLDRYKIHDIDLLIDRIKVDEKQKGRLEQSIQTTLEQGKGIMFLLDHETGEERIYSRFLMCPTTGISYNEPEPNLFSFNSPYGACSHCSGLGKVSEMDVDKLIPDRSISIKDGAIVPLKGAKNHWLMEVINSFLSVQGFSVKDKVEDLPEELLNQILYGSTTSIKSKDKRTGKEKVQNFEGITNIILKVYSENSSADYARWVQAFMNKITCPKCDGTRLKKESLHFKIDQKHIADLAEMDLDDLGKWFENSESYLDDTQNKIAGELLKEIRARLKFLLDVGLNYLSLNRDAKSLSGGEAQRIRLATQIGSELTNVLYILDEPSIGLHQRDNDRLINSLQKLRDSGNTVLVVEHDKDMIEQADFVVDIGPKAGVNGGKIVSKGTPAQLLKEDTLTAKYLNGQLEIEVPAKRRKGSGDFIEIHKPSGNNLDINKAKFPLGKLICVSGVSGSGKSSLIGETLYPILNQYVYKGVKKPLAYKKVEGLKNIDKVIEIDQSPIGRTPRSNPATYTGVFTDIRTFFAQLPEAKIRGYKVGRFSFNVKGGRCEKCKGAGLELIEMNFLPDVYVQCDECMGKRYNRETLEIRYKGKSINDVLNMSIDEAVVFFDAHPKIKRKIETLKSVGLGYITLGQSSTTVSGGEAQRIKLASELSKKSTGATFYILDEPTTGLHFEDIRLLMGVLNRLVDQGNTVLIIEHNLDVIKCADHIIDIGPEGGKNGGRIVAEGTPEEVIKSKNSITGKYLKKELK
jgi:excinuclease ABC subunit A